MIRRTFLAGAAAALASPALGRGADPGLGGLLIAGFEGARTSDPGVVSAAESIARGDIAGVIIMRSNVRSRDALHAIIKLFRSAARDAAPIISIDQEGGKVARLGPENGFMRWAAARDVVTGGDEGWVRSYYAKRAVELAGVGINLNYGPVLDLDVNPSNPIIGALGRSYGAGPAAVSSAAGAFVMAHRAARVATCVKHFPGHGSATTDSHDGVTDVGASWSAAEMEPFRNLTGAGLTDSVMLGHLTHPEFSDGPGIPATLSRRAVTAVRERTGFDGPIISDDMGMGAITDGFGEGSAALMAVNAGLTFLIRSDGVRGNRRGGAARALKALRDGYASGALDAETAERSIGTARRFRASLA